jgi:hypothetical protein
MPEEGRGKREAGSGKGEAGSGKREPEGLSVKWLGLFRGHSLA